MHSPSSSIPLSSSPSKAVSLLDAIEAGVEANPTPSTSHEATGSGEPVKKKSRRSRATTAAVSPPECQSSSSSSAVKVSSSSGSANHTWLTGNITHSRGHSSASSDRITGSQGQRHPTSLQPSQMLPSSNNDPPPSTRYQAHPPQPSSAQQSNSQFSIWMSMDPTNSASSAEAQQRLLAAHSSSGGMGSNAAALVTGQMMASGVGNAGAVINHRISQLSQLRHDPTGQLVALQDINQHLLMGFDEYLQGLHLESLIANVVQMLESASDDNVELKTLCCNVLSQIIEINPRMSDAMVSAIPLLLLTMSCSFVGDILERTIILLEQISRRHGRRIMQAGGISTVMRFYDFVTLAQHRIILKMVANCFAEFRVSSSSSSPADLDLVFECLPSLAERLRESEPVCVERVAQCFARLVTGCAGSAELLQRVVVCCDLFAHFQHLLMASPPVLPSLRMVLQMLAVICHVCPDLVVSFIKQNIGGAIYATLTGTPLDIDCGTLLLQQPLPSPASRLSRSLRRTRTVSDEINELWQPLDLSTSPLVAGLTPSGLGHVSSSNSLASAAGSIATSICLSTGGSGGGHRLSSDDLNSCIFLIRELFPPVPPLYLYALVRFPIPATQLAPAEHPASSVVASHRAAVVAQAEQPGGSVDEDDSNSVESTPPANLLLVSEDTGSTASSVPSSPISSSSATSSVSSETLCQPPTALNTATATAPSFVPSRLAVDEDPRVKLLHSACSTLLLIDRDDSGLTSSQQQQLQDDIEVLLLVQALLPLLFDLAAELSHTGARIRCLEAIQRMLFYSSPGLLAKSIHPRAVCNKLAGLLHSPDSTVLLLSVQISIMLYDRIPLMFSAYLRKEGILDRVDQLIVNKFANTSDQPIMSVSSITDLVNSASLSDQLLSGDLVKRQLDPCIVEKSLHDQLSGKAEVKDAPFYAACASLSTSHLTYTEVSIASSRTRSSSHHHRSLPAVVGMPHQVDPDCMRQCVGLACLQLQQRFSDYQQTQSSVTSRHQSISQPRSAPSSDDTLSPDNMLGHLSGVAGQLKASIDVPGWLSALKLLHAMLSPASGVEPPSSFELARSGVLTALLDYLTRVDHREVRLWLFYRVFFGSRTDVACKLILPPSPFSGTTASSLANLTCAFVEGTNCSSKKSSCSRSSKSSNSLSVPLLTCNPAASQKSSKWVEQMSQVEKQCQAALGVQAISNTDALKTLIDRLLGAFQSGEHFRVSSIPQMLEPGDSRMTCMARSSNNNAQPALDPAAGVLQLSLVRLPSSDSVEDRASTASASSSAAGASRRHQAMSLQITSFANIQTLERVLLHRNYLHSVVVPNYARYSGGSNDNRTSHDRQDFTPLDLNAADSPLSDYLQSALDRSYFGLARSVTSANPHPPAPTIDFSTLMPPTSISTGNDPSLSSGRNLSMEVIFRQRAALQQMLFRPPPTSTVTATSLSSSSSARPPPVLRRRATASVDPSAPLSATQQQQSPYALRHVSAINLSSDQSLTITPAEATSSNRTSAPAGASSQTNKVRRLRSGLVSAFNALSSGRSAESSRRQSASHTSVSSPSENPLVADLYRRSQEWMYNQSRDSSFYSAPFGLTFYIDGHPLPMDMPLYEAIRRFSPQLNQAVFPEHFNQQDQDDLIGHLMWTTTHVLQYRIGAPHKYPQADPTTSCTPDSRRTTKPLSTPSSTSSTTGLSASSSSSVPTSSPSSSTNLLTSPSAALSAAITCLKRRRPVDSSAASSSPNASSSSAAATTSHKPVPVGSSNVSLPSSWDSNDLPICNYLLPQLLQRQEQEACSPSSSSPLAEIPGMSDVLGLLRVLYGLTRLWYTTHDVYDPTPIIPSTIFNSSKLGIKADRQLQDVFSVLSGSLPSWLTDLITATPFLFPFNVRRSFFYASNFDRDRVLLKFQDSNALSQTELDLYHNQQQHSHQASSRHPPIDLSTSHDAAGSALPTTSRRRDVQPAASQSESTNRPVTSEDYRAISLTSTPQEYHDHMRRCNGMPTQSQLLHQAQLYHRSGRRRCHTRLALSPTVKRQRVTVHRDGKRLLKAAEATLEDMGQSRSFLEIAFDGEVGFGLGPTLEFYTMVSHELMHAGLQLWYGSEKTADNYIISPVPGLYPRPLPRHCKSSVLREVQNKFALLGRLMARALLDGRHLDLPLSPAFFKWFLAPSATQAIKSGHVLPNDLHLIDPDLARQFNHLTELANRRHHLLQSSQLPSMKPSSSSAKHVRHRSVCTNADLPEVASIDEQVEDLCLTFTLPGYDNFDLLKNGSQLRVTGSLLHSYIRLVCHWFVVEGVHRQMDALLDAFDATLPNARQRLASLFQSDEMEGLFCGRAALLQDAVSDWSVSGLAEACRCDHGYTLQSRSIRNLFECISEFSLDERRLFLQFVTGSPRLPIGGFHALKPPLKIVMKREEGADKAENQLPSVMTCQNYLKLPDYPTKEVLAAKLRYAINEGQNAFHLS